ELPPVRFTLGGRQELASEPMSTARGAVHLDLPAAYARTLGELRYGGVWRELEGPFGRVGREWGVEGRHPVFAHAEVRVPDLRFGPLVRRPRRRPVSWESHPVFADLERPVYPTGARLRGVWLWEELAEAIAAGARVRVDRMW